MENEKQVFLQLSLSQLEIIEFALNNTISHGCFTNKDFRKAEKLQGRIKNIIQENEHGR